MPDENIDTQNNDAVVGNDIIADSGIDTTADVKDGSDLDAKLDSLIGNTSNAAKASKVNDKAQVSAGTTTNAQAKKPGEEGYVAPRQEQRNDRQDDNRTYSPRAYPKEFKSNSKGDVILAATGEIVAIAGAGRKAFERMMPLITTATSEAEKYKNMYDAASQANTIATQLKLAPEEYAIGARIMAAFKSDPKKAIAFLVSEAQNNGVDVSDLGVQGTGLSVDMIRNTVKEIIADSLKPFEFIHADRQQQEQERESSLQATQAITEFYTNYPDAQVHEDALAKIMNTRPGEIDMEKAYFILRSHAVSNGLDFSKPLVPQIQTKLGTAPNAQPANNGRNLPNMNGRPNNDAIVERKPGMLPGTASSSDIVKEAMREAGMNIE